MNKLNYLISLVKNNPPNLQKERTKMDKLIPLISEIHDILQQSQLTNQIELPQIVAIGTQSVGKSSVIESIIGKEFLPRGQGIVTRRPIEIQLINTQNNMKYEVLQDKEVAEFVNEPGKYYQNFEEVKKKIQEFTDQEAGARKAVSNIPLQIRFYSPKIVDLFMVDLPGIAKNPVEDQPRDIEKKLLGLITPYIENPNSLILAISKAHDDLATSEALKLARQVDPQGERTVGVITQMDVMDEEKNILKDLQNQTYPLKLGYVGVMCRGEKAKKDNVSLEQQFMKEKTFFQNHKIYKHYADKMGIIYLQKALNHHFIQHIKKSLPQIKENIQEQIKVKENDLIQYGFDQNIDNDEAKSIQLLQIIKRFCQNYNELIDGSSWKFLSNDLNSGSRINYIFRECFRKEIYEIDPFDIIDDEQIRIAIENSNGINSSLFIPDGSFRNLVKQQLIRLKNPSLECAYLVYNELEKLIYSITLPEFKRFNTLTLQIQLVMEESLKKCLIDTQMMICFYFI